MIGYVIVPFMLIFVFIISNTVNAELITRVLIGAHQISGSTTPGWTVDQTGTDSVVVTPTSWAGDPKSGTGQGSATATYGSLGVFARVDHTGVVGEGLWYYLTAWSRATFSDGLTIYAPGLQDTQGFIAFTMNVEGTLAGTYSVPMVWANVAVDTGFKYTSEDILTSPVALTSTLMPFTYGELFNFSLSLTAQAGLAGGLAFEMADLRNTMTFTGIQVFDGNKNPVENYEAIFNSGTPYFETVPEPGTLVLLAAGLIGLTRVRRMFRK
jgi:hypothetical protein